MNKHSRSQIVATVGPASREVKTLSEMIACQMDIARLNFSHGTYEEHEQYIKNIRTAASQLNRRIPIIQDLSGPRIQEKSGHHIAAKVKNIITEKDLRDLGFGLDQGLDYIAMSYVGASQDIDKLRNKMKEKKPIIAKVERKLALENLDSIIKSADAIMIARGDLANEVPLEEIPFIERKIIARCKEKSKPVITATQMMLSMVNSPLPTRAEVTDVAFAIISGSDGVMLSEETAIGKFPVEVVMMMEKIVRASEKHLGKLDINQL
jgi:pyruvate kinase